MEIITNADDFGFSEDTVDATIECFERGVLSGATIMAAAPATERALAFARSRPDLSFGVHLVYVGDGTDRPLAGGENVPGLADENGRFHDTRTVRARALLGRMPVDEIVRETAAQIDVVLREGIRPTHVDSHRHLHKFGPFRQALARVLPTYRITRVRTVQDVYLRRPLGSPTYWLGRSWQRRIANRFVTTDHFYMPMSAGDVGWAEPLLEVVATLPGTTLEVGVHPGVTDDRRRAEFSSVVEFGRTAVEKGHRMIGWKDLAP